MPALVLAGRDGIQFGDLSIKLCNLGTMHRENYDVLITLET